MKDESLLPTARRVLVRGVEPAWVQAKLRSYEDLDPPGADVFPVAIRGPDADGWLQVDLDPRMPAYHALNLGMWLVGLPDDPALPGAVILQARWPGGADDWLVPRDTGSVLHGRHADGTAWGFDLAGGLLLPADQVHPPQGSARLFLATQHVPPALVGDWEALPVALTEQVRPWVLHKEGSLLGRFLRGLFGR